MQRFTRRNNVRVDIPNERGPDFDAYHGRHGEVIEVFEDDAGKETANERDEALFRVRFDDGEQMDFR